MKKSVVILLHVGFWACYLILILIMLGVYFRSGTQVANQVPRITNALYSIFLFALVPSFISFYLFYFILFPKYLQKNKILLSIIYGILLSVGTAVLSYILLRYFIESGRVSDMDKGGRNGRSTGIIVITAMTFIGSICGVVALVLNGFITWFNEIKLKELLTMVR